MNSDYNYDAEGQFFPFFLFIMDALVTVPLTWNILKPSTELEQTAVKIESDFKPKDDDLIQAQRRRQRKKERKTKRIIAVVLGWATMFYLGYLVYNAEQTRVKLWDPYDILGVSRVRLAIPELHGADTDCVTEFRRAPNQEPLQATRRSVPSR